MREENIFFVTKEGDERFVCVLMPREEKFERIPITRAAQLRLIAELADGLWKDSGGN